MTVADGRSTTGAWREALQLFEGWIALSDDARNEALDRLRTTRPDLHARLVTLINADAGAERQDFLGAAHALDAVARDPAMDSEPDRSGLRLGPWELERALGSGGMGHVWLARRYDGLYEGEVAIKMLRVAVADAGANARFAREGQLLARLTHPNIAKLLDAGVTPAGQRYLVLEYIDGERIDRYCDERRLDLRARIGLFLQVCAAVAHAHANLIVHRDLKPSNILVQKGGRIKLLDFGVAKLLDAEGGGDATQLTAFAGVGLTPEYAAPEQVAGGAITTATDVYALGMLLYELLSGRRPYGSGRSTPAQLAREIAETDPKRLSARVADADDGVDTTTVAEQRATTPDRLRRMLQGDLDTVVAKALKKEPAERYASAQALGDDLTRYLRHEPIASRPDSFAYRSRKFVRRNRLAVALGALAIVAVLGGSSVSMWHARQATLQAEAATREAVKADAVKRFLLGLFEANGTERGGGAQAQNTTARELLDIGRRQIETSLKDQPQVRSEVLGMLSEMYYQIGRMDQSEALDRERVVQLRAQGLAGTPEMADALNSHAQTLDQTGHAAESRATAKEALAILDTLGDRESELRAGILVTVAEGIRSDSPTEAIPYLEQAFELLRTHYPKSEKLAGAAGILADVYRNVGRLADGRRVIVETLPIVTREHGATSVFASTVRGRVALDLLASNRDAEALTVYGAHYSAQRIASGDAHVETLFARVQVALLLARSGERLRGLGETDAVIASQGSDPSGKMPRAWGRPYLYKAIILLDAGDAYGGGAALDQIDALWAEKAAKAGIYARFLLERARQYSLMGRGDDAIRLARNARDLLEGLDPHCYSSTWIADDALARHLQRAGRLDEARQYLAALEACVNAEINDDPIRIAANLARARDAQARKNGADTAASADAASARIAASPNRAFYALEEAEALRLAGLGLALAGRPADASARLRTAVELLEARQIPESPTLLAAREELRRIERRP